MIAALDVASRRQLSPQRRRTALALAAPAGVAAGFAAWDLGNPSMTGVEAVSYWAAKLPFPSLAHLLHHVDVVHGTYYAGLHVLFAAFGSSTLVMRLPSALAVVASVLLTGVLARRLTGSNRVTLLAAAALALSPVFAGYGQLGRSYALDSALVLALTMVAVRVATAPTVQTRTWWTYTALATVLVYLHEFTVLAVAAHAVTLLWARVPRPVLLRFLAQAGLGVVLALPVIVASSGQDAQVGYLARPNPHTVLQLGFGLFGLSWTGLGIGLALALLGAVGLRSRAPGLTLTRVAVPLLVLPSLVLLAESEIGRPLFSGIRYVLYSTPAAALLVGGGADLLVRTVLTRGPADRRIARPLGAVTLACALALVVAPQVGPMTRVHSVAGHGQDLLAAARVLQRRTQPGDAVAYEPRSFVEIRLVYPWSVRRLTDVQQLRSSESSGTLYGTARYGRPLFRRLLTHRRIWLVTRAGLGPIGLVAFLRSRGYVERSRIVVTGVVIDLFQHPIWHGWLAAPSRVSRR